MDKNGNGEELLLAKLAHSDRLNLTKFTPLKFQQLCILSGCDYLESINGVGALKAAAALNRHTDVKHVRPQRRRWRSMAATACRSFGLTRPMAQVPVPLRRTGHFRAAVGRRRVRGGADGVPARLPTGVAGVPPPNRV